MSPQTKDLFAKVEFEAGRKLASPSPGEEVVISGMAGRYPKSPNLAIFKENLMAGRNDLLSDVTERWWNIATVNRMGKRMGFIQNKSDLDLGYFGFHARAGNTLIEHIRMILEHTVEAIMDAGVNPDELAGRKVSIIIATSIDNLAENLSVYRFFTFIYNYLGHFLKVNANIKLLDTACSGSGYSTYKGYQDIRNGVSECAIAIGINSDERPNILMGYTSMKVINLEGVIRPFDDDTKGFVRSESVGVLFMQKAKDAKRVYGTVIHGKVSNDGFKELGSTYPSMEGQATLLREVYSESHINPDDLSYLECHATGTQVGDPVELRAVDEIICKNRTRPLLIGTVKSNIGHGEGAATVASITKVLLAFEAGLIPPNCNFNKPNTKIPCLIEKRVTVVTDKTPFPDDNGLVGVASYGIGGANAHIILEWNTKSKKVNFVKEKFPYLVCYSGRTRESMETLQASVKENGGNAEFFALLHSLFRKNINNFNCRGYSIISKGEEVATSHHYLENKGRISSVFGPPSVFWPSVAKELMSIDLFAGNIQRLNSITKTKDVDLLKVIDDYSPENKSNYILLSIAIQMVLIDVMKSLEITSEENMGYSFGAISSSYAAGLINMEQALKIAFYINRNYNKVKHIGHKHQIVEIIDEINAAPGKINHDVLETIVTNILSKKWEDVLRELPKHSLVIAYSDLGGDLEGTDSSFDHDWVCIGRHKVGEVVTTFLESLGWLYERGCQPQVDKLYPKIDFPVSRGTPMINPLIKWNHDTKLQFPSRTTYNESESNPNFKISLMDAEWKYVKGHNIGGTISHVAKNCLTILTPGRRVLFPATGFVCLVWKHYSSFYTDLQPVVFKDVEFLKAVQLHEEKNIILRVDMNRNTGSFSVLQNEEPVVKGSIHALKNGDWLGESIPVNNKLDRWGCYDKRDIYKEFRIRGYYYSDEMRGIKRCKYSGAIGYLEWNDNYVAFLDSMLQMSVFSVNDRNLCVPTKIDRISIDPKRLENYLSHKNKEEGIPVYINDIVNVSRCPFVEITGLSARPVKMRRKTCDPILETYKFVPNETETTLDNSVKINVQLALENYWTVTPKIVEIAKDYGGKYEYLAPSIHKALTDLPLMRPQIVVVTAEEVSFDDEITVNRSLKGHPKSYLVIVKGAFGNSELLQEALAAVDEDGFLITRESPRMKVKPPKNMNVLSIHHTSSETFYLMRRCAKASGTPILVQITGKSDFGWLEPLKEALKSNRKVIALSQDDNDNGIIGLVNCLRREAGSKVQAFFIQDTKLPVDSPEFTRQLSKNMGINVYRDGEWGTYRHLSLPRMEYVRSDDVFAELTIGDLSSTRWVQGVSMQTPLDSDEVLVKVYYSALNFRDGMISSGKLMIDKEETHSANNFSIGYEFAGITTRGQRVCGFCPGRGLSTTVRTKTHNYLKIPEDWSLADGATICITYLTALYALVKKANISKGQSVLIHAGSGGVGISAINIATKFGCKIFTTVSTPEKKDFIKRNFPNIPDSNIGSSRDSSFEQMILKQTKGRGVDIVLNSLAEQKLLASIRCVAPGGIFLEIGKADLFSDNPLPMEMFEKRVTFQSVALDLIMRSSTQTLELTKLLYESYERELVKPLPRTIFEMTQVEEALRYLSTGKHVGKVLVKIRDEANELESPPQAVTYQCIPKYYCNPMNSIIIIGGLGGFGLELADWLVSRNAKNLVLSSRVGIKNGYQDMRIELWRKTYHVNVIVSTEDVSTKEGCATLIKEATQLGPVESIFNLGVVLQDALFDKQNETTFKTSFAPKATATKFLDELSRNMCPELRDFVVFSSVSCGRGNIGQTNYGMSNSVMERICEKRKREGYPALAIQWGAVGDVGLVAEMQEDSIELVIGGTVAQGIKSCLSTLDTFFAQAETIVSSMVVAENTYTSNTYIDVSDCVVKVLGIPNVNAISHNITLPELGMDSMTATELKQVLETEFDIILSAHELRTITLNGIKELADAKKNDSGTSSAAKTSSFEAMTLLLKSIGIGTEDFNNLGLLEMATAKTNEDFPVIFVPGIEGVAATLKPLASHLKTSAICLQYPLNVRDQSPRSLAVHLLPLVRSYIGPQKQFRIVAFSVGSWVALEMISMLEVEGYRGDIFFIDGSPTVMKEMTLNVKGSMTDNEFENVVIGQYILREETKEDFIKFVALMNRCNNLQEKVMKKIENMKIPDGSTEEILVQNLVAVVNRLKFIANDPCTVKIRSRGKLLKATNTSARIPLADYGLGEHCENLDSVVVVEADHLSILEHPKLIEEIHSFFKIE